MIEEKYIVESLKEIVGPENLVLTQKGWRSTLKMEAL